MAEVDPDVVFFGDWDELLAWLNWLASGGYLHTLEKELEKIGLQVRGMVRGHIVKQDLGWKPLADLTVSKKGHAVAYIETGKYLSNIRVRTTTARKESSVFIYPYGKYSTGAAVDKVAFDLEMGTSTIPSRPLWRPVAEEMLNMDEMMNFPIEEILGLK